MRPADDWMSLKQLRDRAGLQRFIRPVRPPPPGVPTGAPPQHPASSPAVIVSHGQHEPTRPQGLAAFGAGRSFVGHYIRRMCKMTRADHPAGSPSPTHNRTFRYKLS